MQVLLVLQQQEQLALQQLGQAWAQAGKVQMLRLVVQQELRQAACNQRSKK